MEYLENLKNFALSDINFFLIIAEIFAASLLSFSAVLCFSRKKDISTFFFILTAFTLFLRMSVRILGLLNILYIDEIKYNNISIYSHIIEIIPYITFTLAFILYGNKENK